MPDISVKRNIYLTPLTGVPEAFQGGGAGVRQRAAGTVANSGPPVLHPWLNLLILIEEISTLLTTHQTAYAGNMQAPRLPTDMVLPEF